MKLDLRVTFLLSVYLRITRSRHKSVTRRQGKEAARPTENVHFSMTPGSLLTSKMTPKVCQTSPSAIVKWICASSLDAYQVLLSKDTLILLRDQVKPSPSRSPLASFLFGPTPSALGSVTSGDSHFLLSPFPLY